MAGKQQEMSFWDHLEALRWTILRSGAAVVVIAIALFCLKDLMFSIILGPTRNDFFVYQWLGTETNLHIINTEVAAQFLTHIKTSLIGGVILSFPVIIFEIWRFIAPALYQNEKKAIRGAFLLASFLFYFGVVVGYAVVLPLMVNFFAGYSISDSVANMISLSSYISLFSGTVLIFGLVFEFPTVVAVLSQLGVINRGMLTGGWRYATVAIVVLAAAITPSGDPVSLAIVCLPLTFLYLFSILLCKKKAKEEDTDDIDQ